MVETRRIVARRADVAGEGHEPLLELARAKVAREGGSLRLALRELREQRRARAREIALSDAPNAKTNEDGSYARVSSDPRWPFGLVGEEIIAPFGLSQCGLPRTVDPATSRNGPRKNANAAKREARDLIADKLQRMGCDPISIMAEIAMDQEKVKPEVRLRAAAELASMIYPRLRSTEAVTRDEKTVFVIGIPSERPADASAWLDQAEGPRRIADAMNQAASDVIEGQVVGKSE